MSSQKQKNKEKKTETQIEFEKQCNQLRLELLEKDIMLKRLQQQKTHMGTDCQSAKFQNQELKAYIHREFDKLNISNKSLKDRVTELNDRKNGLEIQLATVTAKLDFQHKEYEEYKKQRDRELEDCKRQYQAEINRLETHASQYTAAINERQCIISQKNGLAKIIEEERQTFKSQLADKERDKIQALDSLKKQMMDKLRSMKSNLLSIGRDQLDKNTRITFLQNHLLVEQLQYQCLNTQNIIDRNVQMEKQIKVLEAELQIRQQVEKQISKRAVFSKKMLQNVQEKYVSLQQQNLQIKNQKPSKCENMLQVASLKNKIYELMGFIESATRKIENMQKQLSLKQSEVEQYESRIKREDQDNQKVLKILYRYLNQLLSRNIQNQQLAEIDLNTLKKKDVKEWTHSEIKAIVTGMLNKFRKKLMPTHLSTELWRSFSDKRVSKLCPIDHNKVVSEEMSELIKCDSEYVADLSVQKDRLFQSGKAKGGEKSRSLTKLVSQNSFSLGKYVQMNVRQWGKQVQSKYEGRARKLAERFMKPIKFRLQ